MWQLDGDASRLVPSSRPLPATLPGLAVGLAAFHAPRGRPARSLARWSPTPWGRRQTRACCGLSSSCSTPTAACTPSTRTRAAPGLRTLRPERVGMGASTPAGTRRTRPLGTSAPSHGTPRSRLRTRWCAGSSALIFLRGLSLTHNGWSMPRRGTRPRSPTIHPVPSSGICCPTRSSSTARTSS